MQAHKLKAGSFIVDGGRILKVVHKDPPKSGAHPKVHVTVHDMANNHRSTRTFPHDARVITTEPGVLHYTVASSDEGVDGGALELSLLDSTGALREGVELQDERMVDHVRTMLQQGEPDSIKVTLLEFRVEKQHRDGKDLSLDVVSAISGFDTSHLYDHHHGRHRR
jgi:translation elongation factor P/translation initiation factor 5A